MFKKLLALPKILTDAMLNREASPQPVCFQNDQRCMLFFIMAILFYSTYMLLMQKEWVLGGEMYAEMAVNYYSHANAGHSIYNLFFAPDAGYVPLLPRLIADIGTLFHFPAAAIPYYYTWSAIILTAMIIGVFCFKSFRPLVKNDLLRFTTVIAILMLGDFENRCFINFAYYTGFFVAIVTALAMVDETSDVPKWAWFIPIFMISKPALLATLPAMIFVAALRPSRFRQITVVSFITASYQIFRMAQSHFHYGFLANDYSFLQIATKIIESFFEFLSAYILGPHFHFNKVSITITSLLILGTIILFLVKRKNNANALIFVGLSLVFFNILLTVTSFPQFWMPFIHFTVHFVFGRHILNEFFGCLLILLGIFCSVGDSNYFRSRPWIAHHFALICFVVWFSGSGWFIYGVKNSRDTNTLLASQSNITMLNNSEWQAMAQLIDAKVSPLCVPIDPVSWVYGSGCQYLNNVQAMSWANGVHKVVDPLYIDFKPIIPSAGKTLVSLAVVVKPLNKQKTFISAQAIVVLKEGKSVYFAGGHEVLPSGELVLMTSSELVPLQDISSIRLLFNTPVELALISKNSTNNDFLLWLGEG